VQLTCFSTCPLSAVASSSGSITGDDGASAYSVLWPGSAATAVNNFSATIGYTSSCDGPIWNGATIAAGSSATVTGALLEYGGREYAATVTFYFIGSMIEGEFEPDTTMVTISGGPSAMNIVPVAGTGAVPMIPTTPVGTCPSGTQGYLASGTFLTFG
jgi:hypothetical protein